MVRYLTLLPKFIISFILLAFRIFPINKNEIAGLIQKRENQLNSIIQNGLEVKNAQIVRLEEALTIAKAIGLTNPALINGNS